MDTLGLALYDGRRYADALTAFERAAELADSGSLRGFTAVVWQGHILDLADRRAQALDRCRKALEIDTGGPACVTSKCPTAGAVRLPIEGENEHDTACAEETARL